MSRLRALLCIALCLLLHPSGLAQGSTTTTPAVRLQGLRSVNTQGSFKAAACLPDGTLVLLYDQGDGLRLLRTDATASTLLTAARQGATGDTGVALALDAAGNIYVAGTSSSGQLAGTSGAAFPAPVDNSLNSFLARFDTNLNLTFLTFLGASRTEVTGIAVTADAVFVAGATYGGFIPTTAGALERAPPNAFLGSGNGFVERFATDGTALTYATYLNGVDGGSVPSSLAANSSDAVYIAGETSSATFPTTNALQPASFGAVSGFLSQLAPDGGSLQFSTFLAGSGIFSLALDPAGNSLLLTGNIASGQFPLATVGAPVAAVPYQTLLRLSTDGQSLLDSALLLPAAQSSVTPGPNGTAWVTGSLAAALSPNTMNHGAGDSFVLHLTSADAIDQLLRIGGTAANNPAYAHLASITAAAALSADGRTLTIPGTVSARTDPSLRASQAFDLGLNTASGTLLPSAVADLLPSSCSEGQSCSGSGGLLTQLDLTSTQASLSLSTGDLPNLTLHNTGSTAASALSITANAFTTSTDCADTLAPFAQCTIALTGAGPGAISVASANAPTLTASLPATGAASQSLALDASEIDFGIVTAGGSPASRTLTVTNLGNTLQTFASAADNLPSESPYTLSETAGTCPGTPSAHTLAPQASCELQIALTASSSSQNDGLVAASWRVGSRDVALTGFTQAASLTVSASELDFGAQPSGPAARSPRFLYLSNSSPGSIAHSALSLPGDSPFTLLDGCPSTLAAGSVCGITLTYTEPNAPVFDSTTVTLDQGLTVLVTGETLAFSAAPAVTAVSPLVVSPTAVTFADAVTVSQLSTEVQTVQITNAGATTVPVAASVIGDFVLGSNCAATLAANQTCTLSLSFAPSQPGIRDGVLTIAAAAGEEPVAVPVKATATPLLLTSNDAVDLGQTVVGEPVTDWFQLQGSFPQISATVTGAGYTVALLSGFGGGHGSLPPAAFVTTATAPCTGCWLAIRFLPLDPGPATGTLQLSAGGSGGAPFQLGVQATAIPLQGLVLTPAQGSFGAVAVGASSAPLTVVLTDLLPAAKAASLQGITVSGDFALTAANSPLSCGGTLEPTASCNLQLVFTPTGKGQRTGTLTVSTDAGSATASLAGIGIEPSGSTANPAATAGVSVFPSQADFGSRAAGTISQIRQFTLLNLSSQIQNLSFSASRNFPLAQPPACGALAPNATCNVSVAFVPEEGGVLTGTVAILATPQDGSGSAQTVLYLRGYGTGSESLDLSGGTSPESPIDFGNVISGATSSQTITLTNSGTASHTIRRLTTTTPFQLATTCTQALVPGAACDATITYAAVNQLPATSTQTPRTDTGTLLIEDDTATGPATVYLAGTALASSSGTASQSNSLPVFTLSQSALTFPNTQPASASPAQVITVANNGSVPVTFSGFGAPADFGVSSTCTVLQGGGTCTVTVAFTPSQLSAVAVIGTLEITSNAAIGLESVSLLASSFPSQLQLSPASLDFGPVSLGGNAQLTATLTNITDLPATLGPLQATGDFVVDASACPATGSTLAAGQSCVLTLTFTPSAPGPRTGSVTLSSPASGTPPTIALSGIGMPGQLQLQPGSVDFGSVILTFSSAQTLTLTNAGTAPLSSIAPTLIGANPTDFRFTSTCGAITLAVGESCTLQVVFTPSSVGKRTASLSISSTGASVPTLVPLTGTGAQIPGFTLSTNGSNTGFASLTSGAVATFPLTLTPQGGYTGAISLTCTPIAPAPNATCSLAAAQLTLANSAAASAVSITTQSGLSSSLVMPLGLLSLLFLGPSAKRKRPAASVWSLALACALLATASLAGCGGGPGSTGNPYTPPGTYQYQVTAASISGPALSSSVTLSITVH